MLCFQCKGEYSFLLSLSLSAFFYLLLHVSLYVTLVCSLLPCSLVAGLKGKCFPVAGTDQINRSGLSDTSNVLFAIPLLTLITPPSANLPLFSFLGVWKTNTLLFRRLDCMWHFISGCFDLISGCIFAFSQHGFTRSAASQIKAAFLIKKHVQN